MHNLNISLTLIFLFLLSSFIGALVIGVGYAYNREDNLRYNSTICIVGNYRTDQYNTCYIGYVTYYIPEYHAQVEIKVSSLYKCYTLSLIQNILFQNYPLESTIKCYIIYIVPNFIDIEFSLKDTDSSFIAGIIFLSLGGLFLISSIIFGILACI